VRSLRSGSREGFSEWWLWNSSLQFFFFGGDSFTSPGDGEGGDEEGKRTVGEGDGGGPPKAGMGWAGEVSSVELGTLEAAVERGATGTLTLFFLCFEFETNLSASPSLSLSLRSPYFFAEESNTSSIRSPKADSKKAPSAPKYPSCSKKNASIVPLDQKLIAKARRRQEILLWRRKLPTKKILEQLWSLALRYATWGQRESDRDTNAVRSGRKEREEGGDLADVIGDHHQQSNG
jgi:hypothetical protein